MSDDPFAAAADELIGLAAAPRVVPPFSSRGPGFDAEAGYRVAARLHAWRLGAGATPVGRKLGFTNCTIWARYGVDRPIVGFVYDTTVQHVAGDRASVPLRGLVQPRMEPEVCFGLGRAPEPRRAADPPALLECIDWVAHAVEIVHCYHPGWKVQVGDTTAANALHGRLVVGPRLPARSIAGLADRLVGLTVDLCRGDTVIDRGRGDNVLGSPLLALAHLVAELEGRRDFPPLAAGELVTTGTLTDAAPIAPGETWATRFSGIALPGLTIDYVD